ncbi:hypothetical protein NE659_28310, partial [Flavonifractor plautii]|nr:hypothetical protein [Flavonifractor plautii]
GIPRKTQADHLPTFMKTAKNRERIVKLLMPSRRHMTVSAFEGIDKKAKPERSLTENLKK